MKYSVFSKASASEYRTLHELDRRASRQRAKRNKSVGTSAALAGMTGSALLYDDQTRNQAGHILRVARNDINTLRGPLSRKLLPKASDRARVFGNSAKRQAMANPRGALALGGASLAAGLGGKAMYHSGRESSINRAADRRRKRNFEATTVVKTDPDRAKMLAHDRRSRAGNLGWAAGMGTAAGSYFTTAPEQLITRANRKAYLRAGQAAARGVKDKKAETARKILSSRSLPAAVRVGGTIGGVVAANQFSQASQNSYKNARQAEARYRAREAGIIKSDFDNRAKKYRAQLRRDIDDRNRSTANAGIAGVGLGTAGIGTMALSTRVPKYRSSERRGFSHPLRSRRRGLAVPGGGKTIPSRLKPALAIGGAGLAATGAGLWGGVASTQNRKAVRGQYVADHHDKMMKDPSKYGVELNKSTLKQEKKERSAGNKAIVAGTGLFGSAYAARKGRQYFSAPVREPGGYKYKSKKRMGAFQVSDVPRSPKWARRLSRMGPAAIAAGGGSYVTGALLHNKADRSRSARLRARDDKMYRGVQ